MFKWYSTFQKPCEVNWTCQFTHPELVAGAVKVRLARSSSLNLASEPMLSSMKCPLPTLLRHICRMPPPATSFLETIQNFPKTGPFFRPLLTEKESAKEMLYRITSTMFGMEFQRQMSRKLSVETRTKIIKNHQNHQNHQKSVRSQLQIFRDSKPTPKWILLLIISDFGWNTRKKHFEKKNEAPRKSDAGHRGSPRAEKCGVYISPIAIACGCSYQAVSKNHHFTLLLIWIPDGGSKFY